MWIVLAVGMSDSGSGMGAGSSRQVRSAAIARAEPTSLTCPDAP